ncbi:hypothetical protein ASE11_20270 [Hydrogenophaga sp. Root209]|uniref:hypothetical protein n=1 Tax=unclassified Hydrogenophaga TaxID=2610897 RepID=UPI0006FFA017|nr:hypothetical protein [Hydrogenophaga sp. Root209]KRC11204.1 hypothetical protein ASE11_20270 [Hydrogenophaga sp. Root209]
MFAIVLDAVGTAVSPLWRASLHPMSSPASHRAMCRPWPIGVLMALALTACNPTFNWRELRPEGTPVQALMPCKPETAERSVPLGGAPTVLHMHSCKAGGLTFALAWADVQDAAAVPATLTDWQRAALAAIRVDPALQADPAHRWAATVAGSTLAQGITALGIDPQGQPVQSRAVYFARGSQVFQAAMYGVAPSDEVSTTFFDGLKLP